MNSQRMGLESRGSQEKSGFSLVEVLVAAGMASILALVISFMMISAKKQSVILDDRQSARTMRDEFQQAINSENCGIVPSTAGSSTLLSFNSDLVGLSESEREIQEISASGITLKAGTIYQKNKILKIRLDPHKDLTTNTESFRINGGNPADDTALRADINIFYEAQIPGSPGVNFTPAPSRHPVVIETKDVAHQEVVGCRSLQALNVVKESCLAADGTWNDEPIAASYRARVGYHLAQQWGGLLVTLHRVL